MKKNDILNLLYKEKNYSKLKKICLDSDEEWAKKTLGKVLFYEGNYKDAARVYYLEKMYYESGYCLLLQGDLANAKRLWNSLEDDTPVIKWGKILIGLIEKTPVENPSYFQVRNFLEQDLDALLSANLITYAENVINSINILAQVNSESYKYIARVLYNHSYFDIAKNFLFQSKDIFYNDPETHFLLAKIYINKDDKQNAIISLNAALDVNQDYFPASNLLSELTK